MIAPVFSWPCGSGGFPPSGMTFYDGDAFPDWRGHLFIGGLSSHEVVRVKLDGEEVADEERIPPLLKAAAEAGADLLTVHVETCPHLHRTLQQIRELGVRPGVTLNPATPLGALEEVLPLVDLVLVMSVNPGFGGQRYIPASTRKIDRLRRLLDEIGSDRMDHWRSRLRIGVFGYVFFWILAYAVGIFAVAGLVEVGFRRLFSQFGTGPGPGALSVLDRLCILGMRLGRDVLAIAVFATVATALFFALQSGSEAVRVLMSNAFWGIIVFRLIAAALRFGLAPHAPWLRVPDLSDRQARVSYDRLRLAVGTVVVVYCVAQILGAYVADAGLRLLIAVVAIVLVLVVLIGIVWRDRRAVGQAILGEPDDGAGGSRVRSVLASNWHLFVTGLLALMGLIAIGQLVIVGEPVGAPIIASLVILLMIPVLDWGVRAMVSRLLKLPGPIAGSAPGEPVVVAPAAGEPPQAAQATRDAAEPTADAVAAAEAGHPTVPAAIAADRRAYYDVLIRNLRIVIAVFAIAEVILGIALSLLSGTDAAVPVEALRTILAAAAARTFNCITVDGDTSTSDTLLLAATGKAGNAAVTDAEDPRLADFRRALTELMTDLAQQVVRDGEGAQKFVTIRVAGAASDAAAKRIGLAIGNSPLVKTAIAGEDANWGRIVMAVGKAGERADRDRLSIAIGGTEIARDGEAVPNYDETPVAAHMAGREIEIDVDVGVGDGRATVWTCDLTHGYIDINADYRS